MEEHAQRISHTNQYPKFGVQWTGKLREETHEGFAEQAVVGENESTVSVLVIGKSSEKLAQTFCTTRCYWNDGAQIRTK